MACHAPFSVLQMDCCVRSQGRVAPDPKTGGTENTLPPRRRRVNGWSKPLHRNQAISWATVLILAIPIFGIFIPMLPNTWKSIAYEVSFYRDSTCPLSRGGRAVGRTLHQGGLQTAAGHAGPLSSVLSAESTRGRLLIPTPHPMPLPLSGCQPPPLPHIQTLSSVLRRLTVSVSWPKCRCSHRSVAPHLRLVQSVHLASRGGQGAPGWGAESRGDRKEGDLNTTAMHRGSCVLSNRKTEFNEDF